jgi:DsbC/DsbD-like thiol-disulfide interchange protein
MNETVMPGTAFYGIPYPGTYIIDPEGKVVSKYFEDDFRERTSASDILVREFGKSPGAASSVLEAKHLRLTTSASTAVARPGNRIALILQIDLKSGMHVYAPGVQGYIPIDWKLEEGAAVKPYAFTYPASQMLHLRAIGETVPVYRGRIQITREITFGPEGVLKPLVTVAGDLIVKGSFRYQACDDRICYIPQTVPLEWHFHFEALDKERVPEALQHKLQ